MPVVCRYNADQFDLSGMKPEAFKPGIPSISTPVKIKSILIGLIALISLVSASPALALRPYLATESAVPIDRGKSRLELGILDNRINTHVDQVYLMGGLTYGVINNLDFEVDFPYIFLQNDRRKDEDGIGDIKLKTKVRFVRGHEANPLSLAGELVVKIPSCNDKKNQGSGLSQECTGEPDVELTGIASKEFFPVTVHLNIGYIFVGNPPDRNLDDVFRYSLAFDIQTVRDAVRIVAELAGENNRDPNASSDLLSILGGVILVISPSASLDVAIGKGLTEETSDYNFTGGVSLFF
jgi:hypothetical protein